MTRALAALAAAIALAAPAAASAQQAAPASGAPRPASTLTLFAWVDSHGPVTLNGAAASPAECAARGKALLGVAAAVGASAATYGCASADGAPTLRRSCRAFPGSDEASSSGLPEIEASNDGSGLPVAWWGCTTTEDPAAIAAIAPGIEARIRAALAQPAPAR